MATWRAVAVGVVAVACAVGIPIAAVTAQQNDPGAADPPEVEVSLGERPASSNAVLPCTAPGEAANFRLYSLGREFDGLPLSTVIRRCDNPDPMGSANYVSYVYGTCSPTPAPGEEQVDGGCAPPVEIQVWPSCERTFGHYRGSPRAKMLPQRRGVPVADVDGWMEVYSADSTVVVFARDAEQANRAVSSLQPHERDAAAASFPPRLQRASVLPPPQAGALSEGKECSS